MKMWSQIEVVNEGVRDGAHEYGAGVEGVVKRNL